jgi:Bifunctional DNA primase/polymerase, N-terminal
MHDDLLRELLDNPMLAAALENARHDFRVYPAYPRGKSPLYRGWQRAATTKPDHLAKFWKTNPEANVGILCDNLVVLDPDSARGEAALADLDLPPTTTVRARRGSHRYFLGRASAVADLLPGVEARGIGQGVLGAGSVHPSGHEYEWEIPPWEVPPVAIPPVLQHLLDERGAIGPGTHLVTDGTQGYAFEGRRHVYLLKFAGSLRGRFGVLDPLGTLKALNEDQCRPPLPPEEVERIARAASRWRSPPLWITDPASYCCTDPRLSLSARMALYGLVHHANEQGMCHPGIRRQAELAGASTRTVLKALSELERHGRIKIKRRPGRQGNLYTLLDYVPGGAEERQLLVPLPSHARSSVFTGNTFRSAARGQREAA